MNCLYMKLIFSWDYSPHPLLGHPDQASWQPIHHSMTNPWKARKPPFQPLTLKIWLLEVGKITSFLWRPHAWFQLKPPYNSPFDTYHISKQAMDLCMFRYQSSPIHFTKIPNVYKATKHESFNHILLSQ